DRRPRWPPGALPDRLGLSAAPQGAPAAAPAAARGGQPGGAGGLSKGLRQLSRAVATAFPDARVELWAPDGHRIGLHPVLKRVWTLPGQRPLAPVELRYHWRYLVAFVHPASGRTGWHLATGVGAEHFTVELAAFAQAVGAGPKQQIVLVLDGAGWHTGY